MLEFYGSSHLLRNLIESENYPSLKTNTKNNSSMPFPTSSFFHRRDLRHQRMMILMKGHKETRRSSNVTPFFFSPFKLPENCCQNPFFLLLFYFFTTSTYSFLLVCVSIATTNLLHSLAPQPLLAKETEPFHVWLSSLTWLT